jgi:hypothetical protein
MNIISLKKDKNIKKKVEAGGGEVAIATSPSQDDTFNLYLRDNSDYKPNI